MINANNIVRLSLTFSAVSLYLVIYCINQGITITDTIPDSLQFAFYIAGSFLLSYLVLLPSKKLGTDNFNNIQFVEIANNDFLSNYLVFFFVALSIDSVIVLIFCFALIMLFIFYSRVSYFNPILLVFGYNFYYLTLANKTKVMLITKQPIKSPDDIPNQQKYKRINDYTFLE